MIRRRVGIILVSAFAVACGGGDANDPTDPGPTPDFTMSVSPTSLQLVLGSGVPAVAAQGATREQDGPAQAAAAQSDVSFTVTISRSGGFSESVTVTVEGLPSGVTASALVIGVGQTSGAVTLTASASANAGTSSPTVRGSATGITAKTQSLSLTLVLPPASGETFDIDFASGSASLVQGNSTSLTLDIDRSGGFMGTVTLSASSNPSGPDLSFDPASTSGTTSTLTVSATAGLTPGDYSVTATGSGGDLEVTATIILTVTASGGGGGGSVSIRFCPENGLPVWLAQQDGTDPWEHVEEGDPGEYSFDFDSGKGGIAFVSLDEDDDATIVVYYGSRDEITTFYNAQCVTDPGKTLMGSFAGVGMGEIATVSLGGASASVIGGGPLNFTLENVSEGPTDLVASITATQSDGMGGFESVLKRAVIRRGTDYAAGSTFATIDFAAEGFDPVRHEVTLTNTLGHSTNVSAIYLTATSSGTSLFAAPAGSTHYFGVPAQEQADGDLHVIAASALENVMSLPFRSRNVAIYQKAAEDLTIDLGPLISAVTVTIEATNPSVRPRVQFAIQAQYNRFWSAGFAGPISGNSAQIAMFEGYEPGATFDRTLPDFSVVDGFDPNWGLQMEQMLYNVIATGWESEGGIAQPQITEGGISRSGAENGTITP